MSREAFELLRLKDRAMDNVKEGITIADCRQEMPYTLANLKRHKDDACKSLHMLKPVSPSEGPLLCCIHRMFEGWLLEQQVKHVI